MSHHFNKDSTFLKRIVTEVIAERDAQIAAALFEVAKNQPHLQMLTIINLPHNINVYNVYNIYNIYNLYNIYNTCILIIHYVMQ